MFETTHNAERPADGIHSIFEALFRRDRSLYHQRGAHACPRVPSGKGDWPIVHTSDQPMTVTDHHNTAYISECDRYRYVLTREFGGESTCLFIMLNPSTADANHDDPTVRRCIGFAKREGFGRLEVVNLYAFRSTSPSTLFTAPDPVGADNNCEIRAALVRADMVIAAWGNNANGDAGQVGEVMTLIERSGRPVKCFGLTGRGQPRHPLYLRSDAVLVPL